MMQTENFDNRTRADRKVSIPKVSWGKVEAEKYSAPDDGGIVQGEGTKKDMTQLWRDENIL